MIQVDIHGYAMAAVSINGGNGNDTLSVFNCQAIGGLTIDGGNGDDKISVGSILIESGDLKIDAGNGDDSIAFVPGGFFSGVLCDKASIDGGNGSDVLTGLVNLHPSSTPTIVGVESVS